MDDKLRELLDSNGFDEYIDSFESNKVLNMETFSMLNDSDLEKLGVLTVGDRKRLLALANNGESINTNSKAMVVYNGRQQRKENIEEDHSYLKAAFIKIDNNIDDLFHMKDEIKGFLIFKKHRYTAEQLLSSPQYRRIKSYISKIDDDIQRWKQSGELSFSLRNTYNVNRELLLDRLEDLQDAIANREPTWWEKVKNFFIRMLAFIAEHLPALWNGLMIVAEKLKDHKVLGAPARVLLSLNKTVQKVLVSKKNIYITEKPKNDTDD